MHLDIFLTEIRLMLLHIKHFMIEITRQTKKRQMFIKTGFNRFPIIQYLQALFCVDFQKYSKARTNVLRHANYISETKM